jgi:hypothetical protein
MHKDNQTGDNECPNGSDLFLLGLSPKRNKQNTLWALCVSAVNPFLNNIELIGSCIVWSMGGALHFFIPLLLGDQSSDGHAQKILTLTERIANNISLILIERRIDSKLLVNWSFLMV